MNENNYGNPFTQPNTSTNPQDNRGYGQNTTNENTSNAYASNAYTENGNTSTYSNPYEQNTSYANGTNTTYANGTNTTYTNGTNMNGNASGYTSYQQSTQTPRKKSGFGTMLMKVVAIALVFGLVSGTVFVGVQYFAGDMLGIRSAEKIVDGTLTVEKVEPTSSGSAKELVDVSEIVDEVMPAIVAITNTSTQQIQSFFGQSGTREVQSAGSGIIVKQDGNYLYIATNNHVVEGSSALTVQFADEATAPAEIKGTDASHDLAVIKVALSSVKEDTIKSIKVATINDTKDIKVGSACIAIGNAMGYGQSVTTGVISALNRTITTSDSSGASSTIDNLIQTDAAINPGNSGGALLNASGQVIAINSAKYSDTSVEGMGYAIPMSDAIPIIEQLISREKVEQAKTAYLGIQGYDVSADVAKAYNLPEGAYVYKVVSGAAADNAGIAEGDIIMEIAGKKIGSMADLKEELAYHSAGETVTMKVAVRAERYEEKEIEVTLTGKN